MPVYHSAVSNRWDEYWRRETHRAMVSYLLSLSLVLLLLAAIAAFGLALWAISPY